MPALVAGIHVLNARLEEVDGVNKSGHDEVRENLFPAVCDPI
jgi:hypothetical protein